jgi:hypothetical protein
VDLFKSYQLFRGESENVSNTSHPVERFSDIDIHLYIDTPIDSGKVYYYKLYEYFLNENGNIISEGSNVIKRNP